MDKATYFLYYRLKMADINGSYKYSNIVKVKIKNIYAISIYPNPVVDLLTIDFTSPIKDEAVLTILNDIGEKLFQKNITIKQGKNTIPINTALLPRGTYILSLTGGYSSFEKFIK